MANEAKNVAVADRPAAAKGEGHNPHADPVSFLLAKGWKCLGNPEWQSSLWLDPTKPMVAFYDRKPVKYRALVRKPYRDKTDGTEKTRLVEEERDVMAQDGSGGPLVAASQRVYHPKVEPIPLGAALLTQIERDAQDVMKAKMAEEARKL